MLALILLLSGQYFIADRAHSEMQAPPGISEKMGSVEHKNLGLG